MSEMSIRKRFLLGCVGGALVVAVNLLAHGQELAMSAGPPLFYLGYLTRSVILVVLGGFGVALSPATVNDRRILIQLGVSAPALLMAALQPSAVREPQTLSQPFLSAAFAEEKAKPPGGKDAKRSVADSEFLRGLTGG